MSERKAAYLSSANISELRVQSRDRFESLTEVLGTIRRSLTAIGDDLQSLTELTADVTSARAVSDELQTTCSDLALQLTAATGVIARSELGEAIDEGLYAVEALQRECRQLSAIASMTRVTGHSIQIDGIEEYIVNLRNMIQRLAQTTCAVQSGLTDIQSAIHHAGIQLREASSRANVATVSRGCAAGVTDETSQSGEVAQMRAALMQSTRANTGTLMKGIQFSDAFSQRLEHIEHLLVAAATMPAAEVLANAQLSALGKDAEDMLSQIGAALEELRAAGAISADALAGDSGEQTAKLLASWRSELADGQRIEELIAPALREAMTAIGDINHAIDAARSDLAVLSATALEVTLATVNAGLLARRSGSAKAAMDVLSTTVRERAHACSEMNRRCRTSFSRIEDFSQVADFEVLTHSTERLRALIGRMSADIGVAAEMFARLDNMCLTAQTSAGALQAAVSDGLNALQTLPGLISAICRMGRVIPTPKLVTGDADDLDQFLALYTMDREREVHFALVGERSVAPPQVAVSGAAQTMDDIFF